MAPATAWDQAKEEAAVAAVEGRLWTSKSSNENLFLSPVVCTPITPVSPALADDLPLVPRNHLQHHPLARSWPSQVTFEPKKAKQLAGVSNA